MLSAKTAMWSPCSAMATGPSEIANIPRRQPGDISFPPMHILSQKQKGGTTMAQIEPITWFRNAHPEQGSLRVQVSAAQGIFPIPGASVEVYRDFGAVRETFYSGVTDSSGIVDRILLPALPASLGLSSDTAGISGTAYTVAVSHPDYHCPEHQQVLRTSVLRTATCPHRARDSATDRCTSSSACRSSCTCGPPRCPRSAPRSPSTDRPAA